MLAINRNFNPKISKSDKRKEKSPSLSGKQIETRNRLAFKK